MKDYSQGKIYKICDESNGDVYIGSTIQRLKRRYDTHGIFKDYNKDKCNCKIILIEDYPCNSKRELEIREQYFIDNTDCINKTRAYQDNNFRLKRQNIRAKKSYHENLKHDETWIKTHKTGMKNLREYQKSWGGRIDNSNNSLLKIDVNLFL